MKTFAFVLVVLSFASQAFANNFYEELKNRYENETSVPSMAYVKGTFFDCVNVTHDDHWGHESFTVEVIKDRGPLFPAEELFVSTRCFDQAANYMTKSDLVVTCRSESSENFVFRFRNDKNYLYYRVETEPTHPPIYGYCYPSQ